MACGTLFAGSTPNCDTPFQGGNKNRLVIMEKDDYDNATKTFDALGQLITLTMPAGKTAWPFSGFKNSAKPGYKKVTSPDGRAMYVHYSEYFVYDYSQSMKLNLQRKANGRYVVIMENSLADVNAFEVLGTGVGCEVLELERVPQDNGGAFKIKIQTPDGEFEAKLPITMLVTDYPTTKAAIDTACAIPTVTVVAPLAAIAAGGTALTLTGTNFFGGGSNSAVLKVQFVNQLTGAVVSQATFTVASNTSITCNSPAMVAGTYKVRVTTIKSQADDSVQNLIVT